MISWTQLPVPGKEVNRLSKIVFGGDDRRHDVGNDRKPWLYTWQIGVVVMSLLCILVLFSVTAAGAGIDDTDRTIEDEFVAPGEETNITVEFELNETGSPAVIESLDPAVANTTPISTSPDSTVDAARDANDELVAVWNETTEAHEFKYQITVAETVNQTHAINGFVETEASEENITATTDVVTVAGVEVAITDAPNTVEAGENISIEYQLKNVDAEAITQDVNLTIDEEFVTNQSDVSINASETFEGTFTYETGEDDIGDREMTVSIGEFAAATTVEVTEANGDSGNGNGNGGGADGTPGFGITLAAISLIGLAMLFRRMEDA